MALIRKGEEGNVKSDKLYYKAEHINFSLSSAVEVNTAVKKEGAEEGPTPIMELRMPFTANNLVYQDVEQRKIGVHKNIGNSGIPACGAYLTKEELDIVMPVFYGAIARTKQLEGAVKG